MFNENKKLTFFSFCINMFSYRLYITSAFHEAFDYRFNYTSFTKVLNLALP